MTTVEVGAAAGLPSADAVEAHAKRCRGGCVEAARGHSEDTGGPWYAVWQRWARGGVSRRLLGVFADYDAALGAVKAFEGAYQQEGDEGVVLDAAFEPVGAWLTTDRAEKSGHAEWKRSQASAPVPMGSASVRFDDLAGCWVEIGEVIGRTARRVHLASLRNLATGEAWPDVDLWTRLDVKPGRWFAGSRYITEGRNLSRRRRQRVPAFLAEAEVPLDQVGPVQPAGDSPQWLRYAARRRRWEKSQRDADHVETDGRHAERNHKV